MAQNNFKAFATAAGANVLSQADWEALAALASGFQSGKANSAQMNKAYRQASMIAAMVGQFIANSGVDALDNGDVAGLVTKFTNALTANLGLGTAAKKDVGTGPGQIPDMSSFLLNAGSPTIPGYAQLPNGLMAQWGTVVASANDVTTSFPVLFPTQVIQVYATSGYTPGTGVSGVSSIGTSINPLIRGSFVSRNGSSTLGGRYLAIGN
ncbi:gp53-like domain-containing protein [Lelliottia amnigena]|uniref:gp53-like domain-containing protein n=1 Tax=Lelliottia amnigena TaxID=61646 RepID=UPI004055AB3E